MEINLTDEERTLLSSILRDALGEVREEVYKSEISEYRGELKEKEAHIRLLLGRLGEPGSARLVADARSTGGQLG